ncbi:MAG: glycoside hydrolase family 5 protein [Anaerocolumna sp.]
MKKFKKIILFHSVISLLALSACSKNKVETTPFVTDVTPTVTNTVTSAVTSTITKDEAYSKPTEPTKAIDTVSTYKIPDIDISNQNIPTSTALDFVKGMKIGWNLGNTFDAYTDEPWFSDELGYETAWCGIKTNQTMIDTLWEAGFHTIRIPVSWHDHVTEDEFLISEVWLNRVQEVVDYAYNKGMYVILNTHHDNQEEYYYPDHNHLDSSKKYIEKIWTQLAKRFSTYDEHLIFESLNEPRLVGTNYEWWLDVNNESCIDAVKTINALNQAFVDTVRNGEGNNDTRYLMVPGYGASVQGVLIQEFELPKDIIEDKLILSVHAYTPYNFALQGPTESGSVDEFSIDNRNNTQEINQFMEQIYDKYISVGIPVVIGEFGARDKNGNTQSRIDYATYYVAYARAYGMTCIWWDNNSFTGAGESFGLLDRKTVTFQYKEIVEGLMKYSTE